MIRLLLISILLMNLAYAQNSGTLKVKKPGFMARNRTSPTPEQDVSFLNRVDTVFIVSDSAVTIHWCGLTGGQIPDIAETMPATRLELGPTLTDWSIYSYVVKFYREQNNVAWRKKKVHSSATGFVLPIGMAGVRFTHIKVRHNNGNRAKVPYLRFGTAPPVKFGWGG